MKEMTLDEIKHVSVDLLMEIHDFCVSNNIRYSLGYGSLIGAIRHQGFIPWDDDLDVVMPRPDYEKFCKTYKSRNSVVVSPLNGDSYMAISRVADIKRTFVKPAMPWTTRTDTGVWIDILPYDGLPDDQEEFRSLLRTMESYYKKVVRYRFSLHSLKSKSLSLIAKINVIKWRILLCNVNIHKLLLEQDAIMKEYPYETSRYFGGGLGVLVYGEKEHHYIEDFKTCVPVTFEGKTVLAMNGYDRVLRDYYGDYMQLPPKDKQVPPHSFHKYYWK